MTHPLTPREKVLLKPCPFCGGEAEIIHLDDGDNAGGSCVCCTRCQASGNVEFEFKENFVSNWNLRTALASSGDHAELARLAETRATEAERKLAEAVGLLRVTLGDLDRRDVTAETASRIAHFLSKEAERG